MAILTKEVLIAKDKRTFDFYKDKGYKFNIKKENSNYRYAKIRVEDLYPKSKVKILAKCEICGKERLVQFNQYRDICHDCSNKKPLSEKTKKKISEAHKGKRCGNKNPSWKGGKPKCEICGKTLATWRGNLCKKCFLERDQKGSKNPNWRDDISIDIKEKNKKDRKNILARRWRANILEMFNYKCDICGSTKKLHAHHLYNWADFEDLRYDLKNGVILCQDCHFSFHKEYGKRNNTKEQYIEFKNKRVKK